MKRKSIFLVIAIVAVLALVSCSGKKETNSVSASSEGSPEIQLAQASGGVSDTSQLEKVGEVWVDNEYASGTQGFLFEDGIVYQVERFEPNTWRIVNNMGTYTATSISFGATNVTSTVTGNNLVLSGMFINYECTRATGQKIDYDFMR